MDKREGGQSGMVNVDCLLVRGITKIKRRLRMSPTFLKRNIAVGAPVECRVRLSQQGGDGRVQVMAFSSETLRT